MAQLPSAQSPAPSILAHPNLRPALAYPLAGGPAFSGPGGALFLPGYPTPAASAPAAARPVAYSPPVPTPGLPVAMRPPRTTGWDSTPGVGTATGPLHAVPEPASVLMVGLGLAGAGAAAWWRRRCPA